MNCNRAQELIATDYMDRELPGSEHGRVKGHIEQCETCREYYQGIIRGSWMPFQDTSPLEPSETVWNRIQDVLNVEPRRKAPAPLPSWSSALESLTHRLSAMMPKPAWSALAFGMMILAAVAVVRPFEPAPQPKAVFGEDFLYLAGVDSGTMDDEGDELGLGLELFLG